MIVANEVEILLVEDNPADVELTLRALKKNNLANRIHVARDGVEALERIKGDPRTRTVPVVVLTSSREEPDVARCYALGVNSYIVKPVEFDSFACAVAQLGLYWMVLNEPPAER